MSMCGLPSYTVQQHIASRPNKSYSCIYFELLLTNQSIYTSIYNIFIKRNSVFVGTIFAGAFVFQPLFDTGINKWYEAHNKGKLWKDVKLTIGGGDDDEEEDDE